MGIFNLKYSEKFMIRRSTHQSESPEVESHVIPD